MADFLLAEGQLAFLSAFVPGAVHRRVVVVGDAAVVAYPNPLDEETSAARAATIHATSSGSPRSRKRRLAVRSSVPLRRAVRACLYNSPTVMYGRCDELPLGPFQPVAEALDTWLATAQASAVGPDLVPLVPRLGPADLAPDRRRLFAAVVDLLADIAATRRVLLVIDDLHWCDPDTTLLLRHIARAGARLRGVLLVLTTRTYLELGAVGGAMQAYVNRVASRRT